MLASQKEKEMIINWVLEREMFNDNHDRLAEAASAAGHKVISWDDIWWENGKWPNIGNQPTIFHGSLGNASRIVTDLSWNPGAFCNTPAFECRSWYDKAKQWLIHEKWFFSTVEELVDDPERCLARIGSPNSFFVRPNSPLKPFSGRVLQRNNLSLKALDYEFYYEDKSLPIVLTPVSDIGIEWRFVIADQNVVASSSYEATNRTEADDVCPIEVEILQSK